MKDKTLGWILVALFCTLIGIMIGFGLSYSTRLDYETRLRKSAESAVEVYIKLSECKSRVHALDQQLEYYREN
jgi:hypothetical protein